MCLVRCLESLRVRSPNIVHKMVDFGKDLVMDRTFRRHPIKFANLGQKNVSKCVLTKQTVPVTKLPEFFCVFGNKLPFLPEFAVFSFRTCLIQSTSFQFH